MLAGALLVKAATDNSCFVKLRTYLYDASNAPINVNPVPPPRTGLGGRYRGFEIVLIQTARPWGRFDNQSARTIRVGEWHRGYTKAYVYNYKSYYIYKFTPYPQDCLITNLRSEGLQHSTALRSRPRCMYKCTNVAATSNIAA